MALLWSRNQVEKRKHVSSGSLLRRHHWEILFYVVVLYLLDVAQGTEVVVVERQLPSTRQLRNRPSKYPDQIAPTLPDITGAFEIEVKLRLDGFDVYNGYNTILNWSNGGLQDAIYIGAFHNPNVLSLLISKNGRWNGVSAYDTIVEGRETTYTLGVDLDGTAWIDVDGTRVATAAAVIPDNVTRNQLSYGSSDFWNTRSLNGAILGLRITNKDEDEGDPVRRQFLQNLPGQFFSSFQASAYIQVDDVTTQRDQGIMDLYTVDGQDNIRVVCTGSSMRFDLYQDNTLYSITADDAITSGELTRWTIGVDASNVMFVQKNNALLASTSLPRLAKVLRRSTVFGNLASGNAPLDGLVLGFRTQGLFSAS